jgi:hypothetical protein
MRKGFLEIMALVCLSMLVYSVSFAASSEPLTASVTLGGPTGVDAVVISVPGTGTASDWASAVVATSLNFDPLTLFKFNESGAEDPAGKYHVFLPNHFYSIDMSYTYTGGAGTITQISFTFAETAKPALQPNGLGRKATATTVRKYLLGDGSEAIEQTSDRITKVLLENVSTAGVTLQQLAGGWLRMYVGLVTKDPLLGTSDIENAPGTLAEVFSPGDLPGPYSGILTVSSL